LKPNVVVPSAAIVGLEVVGLEVVGLEVGLGVDGAGGTPSAYKMSLGLDIAMH
jgi:hypothetical protein